MASAMTTPTTYSRGDVLKLLFPRIDPANRDKERYAIVLSERDYNADNDHGVFIAISSGLPSLRLRGVYPIADWKYAGLATPSVVVPWLWTLPWTVVINKRGELAPYEFRQMIERLREVVPI